MTKNKQINSGLFKNTDIFYLSNEEADKLKNLDIAEIVLVDSKKRLDIFSKLIGKEKAVWVNARFEKDLVLKNQKEGMLNWANETKMKPEIRKEIIKKISGLEELLSQTEEQEFLTELAELSLGIGFTEEEIKTIMSLSQKVEEAKIKMENGGSKLDYEKACISLQEYKNKLIDES